MIRPVNFRKNIQPRPEKRFMQKEANVSTASGPVQVPRAFIRKKKIDRV